MATLLLTVHIVGACIWLGANLFMGFGSSRAEGRSAEVNAWWAETQGVAGRILKNVALVLVLVTGILLIVVEDAAKFSDGFVSLGFLTVIVGGALGGAVFAPGCRKIAESFRSGQTAEALPVIKKLGLVGTLESLLVVVTIAAMVGRWGVG